MRLTAFIILVGLLASCRTAKKVQAPVSAKDTVLVTVVAEPDSVKKVRSVLQSLDSANIQFQTFSAKANIDYRDGEDKKYDLTANIRMYKDSAIWVSVSAILGIEALRAFITKDSVFILDKGNKIYTARSIGYLQEVTSLPLNLHTLQNLLVGNPVFMDGSVVGFTDAGSTISLLQVGQWFKTLTTIGTESKNLLSIKLDDVNASRKRNASLLYNDYKTEGGPSFATKRKITVADKKKLDIELDFKQYSFNEPVEFPFSIPKNYSKG